MIIQVCAGYKDNNDEIHPCGKELGRVESSQDGISHGMCEDCYNKAIEIYKAWKEHDAS